MGREIQKKKNRSGIQKVRQKPKSKKKILGNAVIAENFRTSRATLAITGRRALGMRSNTCTQAEM